MSHNIGVAVYSYRGAWRTACLLATIRAAEPGISITVCEDRDPSGEVDSHYEQVCATYGAALVRTEQHGHMGGCNNHAVERAEPHHWYLVCSDDVLIPVDLIGRLERFLKDNANWPFVHRIAALYLHHWDRADIVLFLPERPQDHKWFYDGNYPPAWWTQIGGKLPAPHWTEPSPPDQVACCSNVHGSAYLVNHHYWKLVGGTAGCDCWQNDSVLSARINNFTDGLIVRLPGLPSIAHRGGAAPTPPDPAGRWSQSFQALANEHGAWAGKEPPWRTSRQLGECNAISEMEWGWKLRAWANRKRYEREIAALDYCYGC